MHQTKEAFFSPSRTILLSIACSIVFGALILSLPVMRTSFVPFIDLLFTATSSICVTGLFTIPLTAFSKTGLITIMILMQIGGLGLITLTLFTVSLFTNLKLATQVMAGQMLDLETWSGTKTILIFIILVTFFLEVIGAFILFHSLKQYYSTSDALFYAIFHSISAFCNAGISLLGNDLTHFNNNYTMLYTLSSLIFLGGIGFITLQEIFFRINPLIKKTTRIYSLQTRIILYYIMILTCGGAIIIWLLERNNTFQHMSLFQQIINSFFVIISSRSAGFFTIPIEKMQHASLLTVMLHSFIGSAPGSTGSGVKITTMALFIGTIRAAIHNKQAVNIGGRKIMSDQIYKALAIVSLSLFWVMIATFCLLITERNWDFVSILFETMSAFTTLGVTLGITPYLSIVGKCLIIVTMFIGRIGSLTLMIALRKRKEKHEFSYPEERVMIS